MHNPADFPETAGLFAFPTPTGLFLPSQQPLSESPKLPALRADVSAKVRARHLGFLLLAASSMQAPYSSPRRKRQVSSIPLHLLFRPNPLRWASAEFFVPHVGATSGFLAFGVYTLGWAAKAAQTADTGATAR